MSFELNDITGQDKDHNPYIIWGEDIARNLDRREFFVVKRSDVGDLRQVYVRARTDEMTAADAFALVEECTGFKVNDVEATLSGDIFAETGSAIEFIATVDAKWALLADLAEADSDESKFLAGFEVIAAGPQLFAVPGSAMIAPPISTWLGKTLPPPKDDGDVTIAGIIDDGIPYLNRRFFDGSDPRIKQLLIQTSAYFPEDDVVETSRTLDDAVIRQRRELADTAGERAIYIASHRADPLLAEGIPAGVRRTVEQAGTHGAFMLDLMAGAAPVAAPGPTEKNDSPDARLRQVPILAAQLPPQSVDDTSGARLELPIIAAMRWMIAKAANMGPATLVINLSFGVSAGSKDGNSFLEKTFERLAAKAAGADLTVHLVLPFGNEYLSRGLQVSQLLKGPDAHFQTSAEIILARADETPSFLEIRAKGQTDLPTDLEVAITNPAGETTPFRLVAAGKSVALALSEDIPGRLFHMPARTYFEGEAQGAYLLLAMSPTAEPRRKRENNKSIAEYPASISLAAPGRWKIHLRQPDTTTTPMEAIFQIQRDDSAFGYQNRGVQTVLDAQDAYAPSAYFRDLSDLGNGDMVRQGTNTAYVARRRQPQQGGGGIHAVAAARAPDRLGETKTSAAPAYYGSQRADWSAAQDPDAAIVLDTEAGNPGVTATGTLSGSAMRLTGSSAAAALFSRNLLLGDFASGTIDVADGQDRLGEKAIPVPDDLTKKKRRRAG